MMDIPEFRFKLTLEKHLEDLARLNKDVRLLNSAWITLKERITEKLVYSKLTYITYSRHDSSHSDSIITSIESFLGEERIAAFSPTDTFLILIVSYIHDIGMALSPVQIAEVLGTTDFKEYVLKHNPSSADGGNYSLLRELYQSGNRLHDFVDDFANVGSELFLTFLIALQDFSRKKHHEGSAKIDKIIEGFEVFSFKYRFLRYMILISEAHGNDRAFLQQLPEEEQGIVSDWCHPRFIATLLRIGDLFDIDNGRFEGWIKSAINNKSKEIPLMSKLNFLKHESVVSLYITPNKVRIIANVKIRAGCDYYTAMLVCLLFYQWFDYIEEEIEYIKSNWYSLTSGLFGLPPGILDLRIYLNNHVLDKENQKTSARISPHFLNKLVAGKDLYKKNNAAFRELLQNAIDASLIKVWDDIIKDNYADVKINYDVDDSEWTRLSQSLFLTDFMREASRFKKMPIEITLALDETKELIYVVIHDLGVGITRNEVPLITTIGSNKSDNKRLKPIVDKMPNVLKPAGYFGIGLQSAFSISNKIEYFSFVNAEKPLHIILEKNEGSSTGRFVQSLEPDEKFIKNYFGKFAKGTYALIRIDYKDLFKNGTLYEHFKNDLVDMPLGIQALKEITGMWDSLCDGQTTDYFKVTLNEFKFNDVNSTKKNNSGIRRMAPAYPNGSLKLIKTLRSTVFNTDHTENKNTINMREKGHFITYKGRSFYLDYPMFYIWNSNKGIYYSFRIREVPLIDDVTDFVSMGNASINAYYRFGVVDNPEILFENQDEEITFKTSLLDVDIYIFDGCATEYIQIDRDHLKESAKDKIKLIDEIQTGVTELWEYISKFDYIGTYLRSKYSNSKDRSSLLEEAQNFLITLAFLFVQFKSTKEVFEFLRQSIEYVLNIGLIEDKEEFGVELRAKIFETKISELRKVGNETPFLREMLEEDFSFFVPTNLKTFKLQNTMFRQIFGDNSSFEETNKVTLLPATQFKLLPRKGFRIMEISHVSEWTERDKVLDIKLAYKFAINSGRAALQGILMDHYAEFYEIYLLQEGQLSQFISAAFKPNSKYKNLIISVKPFRSKYLTNWIDDYDINIDGLIVSPFTQECVNIFSQYKNKIINSNNMRHNNTENGEIFIKQEGKMKEEIIQLKYDLKIDILNLYNTKSTSAFSHLRDCINYIIDERAIHKNNPNTKLINGNNMDGLYSKIENEYKRFIESTCEYLIDAMCLKKLSKTNNSENLK